jgi:prolyl-tRNA synthetase
VRLSRAFVPTLKETPAEATAASHVLMLRAGMARQLMAGVYTHLPLGWRTMNKVMQIIREEMDAIGAQELYMPALNPLEVWEETGRAGDFGDVLMKLTDRKGKKLCLAPTHEEVVCFNARDFIRSYRDLPQIWYHIQLKFRDEERPRGGVLRTCQFIMKDSYTLDVDQKGLDYGYALHRQAYMNIFSRAGLHYFVVGASSGLMGGSASEEFMVPSISGEDRVARCEACGYAANVEVASSRPEPKVFKSEKLEKIPTPGMRTIEDLVRELGIEVERTAKSRVCIDSNGKPVLVLVRGDYEVNDEKLLKVLGPDFRPAHPDEVKQYTGAQPGSVGPVGLKGMRIFADEMLKGTKGMMSGANEDDFHFKGIELARDAQVDLYGDFRVVKEGDPCPSCGKPLKVLDCIEVGHIFKLGTKYADAMGARYLDEGGQERPIVMGSYGIGVERIAASAIEQDCDEGGIVWPLSIAPYQVHLLSSNPNDEKVLEVSEKLYRMLLEAGIEVLYDDRQSSAGFKFKDADLIGIPYRIVVGTKSVAEGVVELQWRKDGRTEKFAPDEKLIARLRKMIDEEMKRLRSQCEYPVKSEAL